MTGSTVIVIVKGYDGIANARFQQNCSKILPTTS